MMAHQAFTCPWGHPRHGGSARGGWVHSWPKREEIPNYEECTHGCHHTALIIDHFPGILLFQLPLLSCGRTRHPKQSAPRSIEVNCCATTTAERRLAAVLLSETRTTRRQPLHSSRVIFN